MKAVLGIFLFITSAIALIFLVYFDINFFWYFLLVITGSAGIFLVIGPGKKRIAAIERQIDQRIERLKANGEQITLDFQMTGDFFTSILKIVGIIIIDYASLGLLANRLIK